MTQFSLDSKIVEYNRSISSPEYQEMANNSGIHAIYVAISTLEDFLYLIDDGPYHSTERNAWSDYHENAKAAPEEDEWELRFEPGYKPNTHYASFYNNDPAYEKWWYSQRQESVPGAAGTDVIDIDNQESVQGAAGTDVIKVDNQESTDSGDYDLLTGTNKGESIKGTKQSVKLFGLGGNDKLFGSKKDDILDGGEGNDILNGKKGADTYVLSSGKDKFKGFKLKQGDKIEIDSDITYTLIQSKKKILIKHDGGVTTVSKVNQDDLISVIEIV